MKNLQNKTNKTTIFDDVESAVQSYARSFPVVFDKAQGAHIYDREGNKYIDFLAGAGSLNYGHNHPVLKKALIEYIEHDGITHGLDFHSAAKEKFLQNFKDIILTPRGLDYRVQFTGPTGANAVEAALKLARMVKNRTNVIAFTNGFHGVTPGALAATGNAHHRGASGISLEGITRMPFDDYMDDMDTLGYMDQMLSDNSSGIDHPAAVIVECIQGEGGLNAARLEWLKGLEELCHKYNMLLIVDDIQAGCGRSGTFFSFEPAGINPDIVTLSKSISGYGLPFAITIFKPELDQWKPGEHNGTFRGNNHAFITAATALEHFWSDDTFAKSVQTKGEMMKKRIEAIIEQHPYANLKSKGRGMMRGIECESGEIADKITAAAFEKGVIIETSGPEGQVVKCLCSLTITEQELMEGWEVVEQSFAKILGDQAGLKKAA